MSTNPAAKELVTSHGPAALLPPHEHLRRYLHAEGWAPREGLPNFEVYVCEQDGERFVVRIPLHPEYEDYERCLDDAFATLARVEGTDPQRMRRTLLCDPATAAILPLVDLVAAMAEPLRAMDLAANAQWDAAQHRAEALPPSEQSAAFSVAEQWRVACWACRSAYQEARDTVPSAGGTEPSAHEVFVSLTLALRAVEKYRDALALEVP